MLKFKCEAFLSQVRAIEIDSLQFKSAAVAVDNIQL